MTRIDNIVQVYTHNRRFATELKQFHRVDEMYFQDNTSIEYDGDVVSISLSGKNSNAKITRKNETWGNRYNTKISYIPAERNLVSAVRNINSAYKTDDRDVLFNFILEWNEYRRDFTKNRQLNLSLTNNFKYYDEDGQDYIVLPNGNPITSFFASSGVQSIMPIDVISEKTVNVVGNVTKYSVDDLMSRMIEILDKNKETEPTEELSKTMESMREYMKYKSAQLFIEEPEQNLYPDAQRTLILNLVRRIKKAQTTANKQSMLMLTTHSPYVLSVLNALIADAAAKKQKPDDDRLNEIIDESTLLPVEAYSAYYINKDGVFEDIKDLEIPMFSGIDLDCVSDWVDEHISRINDILYSE
ncbi:AAA family ATPase [Segatella copri]